MAPEIHTGKLTARDQRDFSVIVSAQEGARLPEQCGAFELKVSSSSRILICCHHPLEAQFISALLHNVDCPSAQDHQARSAHSYLGCRRHRRLRGSQCGCKVSLMPNLRV